MHDNDVSLCFAAADLQFELYFPYESGLTVASLLSLANLHERWSDRDWSAFTVGIWSKLVSETTVLQAGDRVELYRPLIIDPKSARRLRSPTYAKRPRVRRSIRK